jgi:hypothetical protein
MWRTAACEIDEHVYPAEALLRAANQFARSRNVRYVTIHQQQIVRWKQRACGGDAT